MKIAYKYRIYPTKTQEKVLMRYMKEYNYIQNVATEMTKIYAIKEQKASGKTKIVKGVEYPYYKFPSTLSLQSIINSLKKESQDGLEYIINSKTLENKDYLRECLNDLPASCSHYIAMAIKSAIDKRYQKNAYKGSHKKPHFIKYDNEDILDNFHLNFHKFNQFDCSYTVQQQQQSSLKIIEGKKAYFSAMKVGNIKMVYHRPIPENSKFDAVIISKKGSQWYISLGGLTIQDKPIINKEDVLNAVGIDKNTDNYFVSSDNEEYINPINKLKKLNNMIKKIYKRNGENKKDAKTLSKRVYGSQNYLKAQLKVNKLYQRIDNIKKAILNNASKHFVEKYDAIFVEDLSVKGMQRAMGSMVQKNNFFEFDRLLAYKATLLGKIFQKIGRFYASSQICSKCGKIHPEMKNLNRRVFRCDCGNIIGRDYNAAINIREEGLRILQKNEK